MAVRLPGSSRQSLVDCGQELGGEEVSHVLLFVAAAVTSLRTHATIFANPVAFCIGPTMFDSIQTLL
jgi:hypothetical protein